MSNSSAIDVYLRVRPTSEPFPGINLLQQQNKIQFFVKKDPKDGYINNSKQKRMYPFNQLFDMTTKQGKMFDRVAKQVIEGALQGYNGTIFAYGQTGSGKTYTMTGNDTDFQERGIIPRTFDYLFQEIEKRTTENILVYASFFQIYNGVGYDLCPEGKNKEYKSLDDLEKIIHRKDADGQTHLLNLTVHELKNRSEAFGMLMEGDTNRIICKTPMNDQSTRSHCIFRILLETRKNNSDIKTTSTIHLVDLSGSERIKNTDVTGEMQYEARSINLTLHYLQRVITCITQNLKGANNVIPYRQSLLTMILKNSFGGNCRTKMVATISAKEKDLPETISTCEFAKRISCIKNSVFKNESVDPQVIITKLRNENAQLKAELALLKGQDCKEFLDQYDIEDCHKKVDKFMEGGPGEILVFNDRLMIQECFQYFKSMMKGKGVSSSGGGGSKENLYKQDHNEKEKERQGERISFGEKARLQEEIKKLKLLNMRQQQQIVILVTQIKKYSNNQNVSNVKVSGESLQAEQVQITEQQKFYKNNNKSNKYKEQQTFVNSQTNISSSKIKQSHLQKPIFQKPSTKPQSSVLFEKSEIDKMLLKPLNLKPQQLLDRSKACDDFRRNYKKQEIILKNQTLLKQKIMEGKECNNTVKKLKEQINNMKNQLEEIREQILIDNMNNGIEGENTESEEENRILRKINDLREQMKGNINNLRRLKSETEGIEDLLKRNYETYNRDMEKYLQFVFKERKEALDGVDQALLKPKGMEEEVQKALERYQKERMQIRGK